MHQIKLNDGSIVKLNLNYETLSMLNSIPASTAEMSSVHRQALKMHYKTFAHKEFMIK